MVNLTARSIRHFIPNAELYCVSLYKKESVEYRLQPDLEIPAEHQFFAKTKYHGMGSAVANAANGLFFSEGYNEILKRFENTSEKVLLLAEDHFFTSGTTLRELEEKEFDIAYAPWDSASDKGANGSILCVRPNRVLPIPEQHIPIEGLLMRWIDSHSVVKHPLSTRTQLDYKGDGFYTNSELDVRLALIKAAILS